MTSPPYMGPDFLLGPLQGLLHHPLSNSQPLEWEMTAWCTDAWNVEKYWKNSQMMILASVSSSCQLLCTGSQALLHHSSPECSRLLPELLGVRCSPGNTRVPSTCQAQPPVLVDNSCVVFCTNWHLTKSSIRSSIPTLRCHSVCSSSRLWHRHLMTSMNSTHLPPFSSCLR
ncbi:hypothetical protein E2C01_083399 [Portunus trituberculatus]|uniref:Uncharacterized protein n=1 Tax=Portunus trituberculatus TaxID=210409 RepID=A0A5B7J1X0_PORTR|nr:hypothetical protein [Portunus trituberculatus]